MRKAAQEKKVITQVGNQGHSSHTIRLFVEMVQAGAIGNISEIHAGCDAFRNASQRLEWDNDGGGNGEVAGYFLTTPISSAAKCRVSIRPEFLTGGLT